MRRVGFWGVLVVAFTAGFGDVSRADETDSLKAQVYQLENALESTRDRADRLTDENTALRDRVEALEDKLAKRSARVATLEQRLSANADTRKAVRAWKWRARAAKVRATRTDHRAQRAAERATRLAGDVEQLRGDIRDKVAAMRGRLDTFFGRVAKVIPESTEIDKAEREVGAAEGAGGPTGVDGIAQQVAVISERMRKARDAFAPVPFGHPLAGGETTSRYGPRTHPVTGERDYHTGEDIAARRGTPIRATGAGRVTQRAIDDGYGRFVKIDHPGDRRTLYAHMSKFAVAEGDRVSRGDVIGYVGSTGVSTGPHLHYEIRVDGDHLDPAHYSAGLDGLADVVAGASTD